METETTQVQAALFGLLARAYEAQKAWIAGLSDAERSTIGGTQATDIAIAEADLAFRRPDMAKDRLDEGRLTAAVGAENRNDSSRLRVEIEAVDDLVGAISGMQVSGREQRHHSSALRDRPR